MFLPTAFRDFVASEALGKADVELCGAHNGDEGDVDDKLPQVDARIGRPNRRDNGRRQETARQSDLLFANK